MKWFFVVLATVAAQTAQPLLPAGVTLNMVTKIQVSIPGTVQFLQSDDGSSTIASRLATTPTVSYDNVTGILYVSAPLLSGAPFLQPGMLAAVLSVFLWAVDSKHSPWLLILGATLGVTSAQSSFVVTDVTIRVPGCWHTEGEGGEMSLFFDQICISTNVTKYKAPTFPIATWIDDPTVEWKPMTPADYFYPVDDSGTHFIDPEEQYEVWRAEFGLPAGVEDKTNFLVFTARCMYSNKMQGHNRSWHAGCNQFSNMALADWMQQILANNAEFIANANAGRRLLGEELAFNDITETQRRKLLATTEFSWVGTGRLTPVKNQGNCGSCYAHSTTSQMEAALAIATNTVPVPLAREQLKNCAPGAPGCGGGSPPQMFTYAATNPLTTEARLPYVAANRACPNPIPTTAFKDGGYTAIANNEVAFQAALANGPVAVTVCASTWDNYMGGVFTNCAGTCTVDHAVLLVGYGVDPTLGDYFLVQNSWGTTWGEKGFMRLPNKHRSTAGAGACGLTKYAGYMAKSPVALNTGNCQGSWSTWTTCTKTCGGGTQTKTWTTTTPASGTGTPCPNPTTVSQSCNNALCPVAPTTRKPTTRAPTTRPPTNAVPTVKPPTNAVPTVKPPTNALPTNAPPTNAPPTNAPPTNAPPTNAPPAPTPASTSNCIYVGNSVLGTNGNGNYTRGPGWTETTSTGAVFCGQTNLPQYVRSTVNGDLALFFFVTNCYNNQPTAGMWGLGDLDHGNMAYQWSSSIAVTNGVYPPPNAATGWTLQFGVCRWP